MTRIYIVQDNGKPLFEVEAQDEKQAAQKATDKITADKLKVEKLELVDKATGYFV